MGVRRSGRGVGAGSGCALQSQRRRHREATCMSVAEDRVVGEAARAYGASDDLGWAQPRLLLCPPFGRLPFL